MAEKKNILTYEGLKALEEELQDLKLNRRKQVAIKIKEAREQGDLSENAEYDAAKDEQRDIELRIEEIDKILKNAEVVDEVLHLSMPLSGYNKTLHYRQKHFLLYHFRLCCSVIQIPY